jgi:PAS domain-containing protein
VQPTVYVYNELWVIYCVKNIVCFLIAKRLLKPMTMGFFVVRLTIDAVVRLSGTLYQEPGAVMLDVTVSIILVGLALLGLALAIIARRDEALRNSQIRLSAIIDTALDGVLTIDRQGVIRSCNPLRQSRRDTDQHEPPKTARRRKRQEWMS